MAQKPILCVFGIPCEVPPPDKNDPKWSAVFAKSRNQNDPLTDEETANLCLYIHNKVNEELPNSAKMTSMPSGALPEFVVGNLTRGFPIKFNLPIDVARNLRFSLAIAREEHLAMTKALRALKARKTELHEELHKCEVR